MTVLYVNISKHFLNQSCRENRNRHFKTLLFPLENCAVCEIMWKYIVEPNRPQIKMRRMSVACWILQATNTHSEYVIIIAFLHYNNGYTNAPRCNFVTVTSEWNFTCPLISEWNFTYPLISEWNFTYRLISEWNSTYPLISEWNFTYPLI
jgi:hypothetical protein